MVKLIIPIIVLIIALAFFILLWSMTRTPKVKPVAFSRDDPLYRGFVGFTRKVAYFNDTAPEWALMIPAGLQKEARDLLEQEKEELKIRNES